MATTMHLFIFCFVIAAGESLAQSIKRESISSTGSSNSNTGAHVSETVGQPYGTSTAKSGKTVYHPGFQQSVFRAELISSTVTASIMPNPALMSFYVVTSDTLVNASMNVFDEAGRLIYTEDLDTVKNTEVRCALWANGAYLVNITDKKGNLVTARLIKHQ